MKKNKQTKKQKEATKTFWLVALVVALVAAIGLVQHHDDLKELANKDEVVEEAPEEVIILEFTLTHPSETEYKIVYEKGMTWGEWLDSDYNTFEPELLEITSDSFTVFGAGVYDNNSSIQGYVLLTDVIDHVNCSYVIC